MYYDPIYAYTTRDWDMYLEKSIRKRKQQLT